MWGGCEAASEGSRYLAEMKREVGRAGRQVRKVLGETMGAPAGIYTQVTAAVLREVFTLSHPRARGTDASAR